jgi:hypothetical protein
MTAPPFRQAPARRPTGPPRPGRNAIRALTAQVAVVVVALVPWIDPEPLYDSGLSGIWANLFLVGFFAILPLSILVLVLGIVAVTTRDRRGIVRGRIAIVGAVVGFIAAVVIILAGLDAQMM